MNQRVLLVDDEPNVLHGYQRHLRHTHQVELAIGGRAAVEAIKKAADGPEGPFAVVVSDMQMPELSGIQLFTKIRARSEHTVRVMLTGNADQQTAADAVNESGVFRFLNKPCSPKQLAETIDAALEHHRLIKAEAELLSQTLSGSVRMLTQVLSIAMPDAFGLTQQARAMAHGIAVRVNVGPLWQVEMAAMLMRIGCVSLPTPIREKYLAAERLSDHELALVEATPQIGAELVGAIPRLEPVADIIAAQMNTAQDSPPMASRILRVVGEFQRRAGSSPFSILDGFEDPNVFEPDVVEALREVIIDLYESREVGVGELREGMILEGNVEDAAGRILIANGTEIHAALIQKLMMLRRAGTGVREPIPVRAMGNIEAQANHLASDDFIPA
ncbi:MAG: response regulator [Planctomycetota bacterium]